MIPDYIKLFASIWVFVTCLFWTKILVTGCKQKRFNLSNGLFAVGALWLCSGLAPVWGIVMVWKLL